MAGQIRVRASLRLVKEDKLFGPGAAQLLAGVDELGSLRRSAARMEMSYNKAWSVIHGCEEQLGFALLERRSGGEYPIKETTLYSAFGRLEKQGYIVPYQGSETQGRPRTYYTITDEGRKAYTAKCAEWLVLKAVVDRFAKEDTTDGSDS